MTNARAATLGFCAAWIVAGAAAAAEPKAVIFEVEAGQYARRDTPLMVRLPGSMTGTESLALENLDDHTFVPVQSVPEEVKGYPGVAWIVREPLAAGAKRRYRLTADPSRAGARPGAGVLAFGDGKRLAENRGELDAHKTVTLKVGDRPVLTYLAAVAEPPAGIEPVFRRSGFIHPLQSPSGRAVTDDFPPDHAHQHGVFFAWVNTTFEGRHVDFWNQKEKTGNVRQAGTGAGTAPAGTNVIQGGPVFGTLRAELLHEDLTAPKGPKPVLWETWRVVVYDVSGHGPFVVDFHSEQNAVDAPLSINKYHYGGMGLRGNRAWFDPTVKGNNAPDPARSGRSEFLTSEGKHRADGNHTRPRWVDFTGEVGGELAGLTIMDSPANYRFPQPIRIHPNKPYFCFSPMVDGEFAITRGHPYVSDYRLLIHDGPADPETIERLWHDYAEPPQVRVVSDAG